MIAGAEPKGDVAWKMGERWVLVTGRSPREMGKEPMAIYYPKQGPRRFQYVMDRRPRNALCLLD